MPKSALKGWRAFSLTKEATYGTYAIPTTSLNFEGDPLDITPEIANDAEMVTGYEEVTATEILKRRLDGEHAQRLTPHCFALFASLAQGKSTASQPDGVGEPLAYQHVIERLTTSLELPSRTMVQYDGLETKYYCGIGCTGFKVSGERGGFVNFSASLIGDGQEETSALSRPALVAESYLRYGDCGFNIGGAWNGTAYSGGTDYKAKVREFSYEFANGAELVYDFGAGDAYATRIVRGRNSHVLTATLELEDTAHKTALLAQTEAGIRIPIVGAAIAAEYTNHYQVDLVFPATVYTEAARKREDDKLVVNLAFQVLEDATYGSAVWIVKNKQTSYLTAEA